MRFSSPTICALIGLMLGFAPLVRAADPQPYKVDRFSTGQSAMDATLRATSDLVTLRTTAPVGSYGLIARARGDIDRLKTVLESYGYYDSKGIIKIDGLALNDPRLPDELAALPKKHDAHVQVSFELGPLYHLRNITIEGELPPSAQAKFTLATGDPAVASNVLAAGTRVLAALEDEGYAFAKVDPPVAFEDKSEPVLDVTFHVETGPKLNVGHIYIEGLKRTHESLVRRRLLLHTGELYRASVVEHARADLLSPQLGVFAAITVKVGKAVDDTGGIPITFQVRERLRHTFGLSAAYSSDLGGSGGINWGDRDMLGNAEQFNVATSITGLGGSSTNGLGYDVPIRYILPDFGRRDQSLQFGVEAVKEDLIAYDQTALKLGVTLTRKVNKLWTVSAGVTVTEENINQVVEIVTTCSVTVATQSDCLASDVEASPNRQTYNYSLLGLPLTGSYDSTNLVLPMDDPTHGMRVSVSIVPTLSLGHTRATFLITTIKAAAYFDLDHLLSTDPGRSVLAARALIGAAGGASADSLPPDQRFYGGGSASIRGYPYQGVGPYFPIVTANGSVIGSTTYPVGATTISAAGLEYRQRFGQRWGAAFFVDGGQVGSNLSLYPSNPFVGVGAGARYYTPIGPIRLDIAFPLKRYDSDPQAFQVYIGLGQAF
jgi:translocation and assembly module TamA